MVIEKKITIAIDGYSSCGKSTLARQLAKELGYSFIDSGAMYRAITLYSFQHGIISEGKLDTEKLISRLEDIHLEFAKNAQGLNELKLNGEFVEDQIRKPKIASFVSQVARIKEVREKLVASQRKMGADGGIVMDG